MLGGQHRWRAVLDRALREGEETLDLSRLPLGNPGAAEVAERVLNASGKVCLRRLDLQSATVGDVGAAAVAELLRNRNDDHDGDKCGNIPLEILSLQGNGIRLAGIKALADAVKRNSCLRVLNLWDNPGVYDDPDPQVGSEVEEKSGIEALVAAIGVNTALEHVPVHIESDPRQQAIDAALADSEGRRLGREKFLTGSLTKAAHKKG
jgi:Leucine Rich repeat